MEGQVVNILIPLKSLSIFVLGTNVEDYLHLGYGYISKEEMQVYSDIRFQILEYHFQLMRKQIN